jgi:hypothetical protein
MDIYYIVYFLIVFAPQFFLMYSLILLLSGFAKNIKKNIFKLEAFLYIVPLAIAATIFYKNEEINNLIFAGFQFLYLFFILWLRYKPAKKKEILRLFFSVIAAFAIVSIFHIGSTFITGLCTEIKYTNICSMGNSFIYTSILSSIMIFIFIFFLMIWVQKKEIKLRRIIFEHKLLLYFTIGIFIFTIAYISIVIKHSAILKTFCNLPHIIQFMAIVMSIILPSVNILIFWMLLYNISVKENYKRKVLSENISTLTSILNSDLQKGKLNDAQKIVNNIKNIVDKDKTE